MEFITLALKAYESMEKLARKISTAINQTECDEMPQFENTTSGENVTIVIEWDFVKECDSNCDTHSAWHLPGYF